MTKQEQIETISSTIKMLQEMETKNKFADSSLKQAINALYRVNFYLQS